MMLLGRRGVERISELPVWPEGQSQVLAALRPRLLFVDRSQNVLVGAVVGKPQQFTRSVYSRWSGLSG